MNTFCQESYLNKMGPYGPIQSLDALFLPKFNRSGDVNFLASLNARPNMPYKNARAFVPAPNGYNSMASSLPSGRANYDRSSIRQFNQDMTRVYPYMNSYQNNSYSSCANF